MHRTALHDRPRPSRAIPDRPGPSARAVALPGFSLLELAIVMAVMAIVLAIAMPRHAAALDRYRADGAANGLVGVIQRERAAAASTGVPRRLAFDAIANSYTVVSGGAAPTKILTASLGDGPFPATLSVADFDGGPDLRLDAFGGALAAGSIVLVRGREIRTLVVTAGPDPTFRVIVSQVP